MDQLTTDGLQNTARTDVYPSMENESDSHIKFRENIALPPSSFVAEVIGVLKYDGDYCHGMRIRRRADGLSPTETFDSSFSDAWSASRASSRRTDRSALSSMSGAVEYEIWRTWEECLLFQAALEQRYTELARAKRAALRAMQAKHAKNLKALSGRSKELGGLYSTRSERTASFASLPTGPDPRMVAKDVHQFLPKLTLKGSMFYTSAAEVQKQADQLIPFIEALWGEGVMEDELPSLVLQLKEEYRVLDFFSCKAHDCKVARKHGLGHNWELRRVLDSRRSMSSASSYIDSDRQSITSSNSSSSTLSASRSSVSVETSSPRRLSSVWRQIRGRAKQDSVDNAQQQQQNDRVIVHDSDARDGVHRWREVTAAIPEEYEGEDMISDKSSSLHEQESIADSQFSDTEKDLPLTPRAYELLDDGASIADTVSVVSESDYATDYALEEPQFEDIHSGTIKNRDSVMTFRSFMTTCSADAIISVGHELPMGPARHVRPSIENLEFEEVETPTIASFGSSMARNRRSRRVSGASTFTTSTIMENRDEEDDDLNELIEAFQFAPLDSPMKFSDSRPVSVASFMTTGSISISPPDTPTTGSFPSHGLKFTIFA